jgi:hypothetical protein
MVCLQTKNSNLGKILEGLVMENAGTIYDRLEYQYVLECCTKKNRATLSETVVTKRH